MNAVSLKRLSSIALKVLILVLLIWAIYIQLFQQQQFENLQEAFYENIHTSYILIIALVLTLMPPVWYLETQKWRNLIQIEGKPLFIDALKGVLSGVTLAFFTPNRIGDYAGRILFVKNGFKAEAVKASIAGSLSQFITTIAIGLILLSTTLFKFSGIEINYLQLLIVSSIIFLSIAVWCFIRFDQLSKKLLQLNIFRKWSSKIKQINSYTGKQLGQTMLFSISRYLLFSTQYVLLLILFGVDGDLFLLFGLVGISYLIQTIIPSFALLELGIRGNVAMFLFGQFGANELAVLAATSLLWIINLLIPALIGSLILFSVNFFGNES